MVKVYSVYRLFSRIDMTIGPIEESFAMMNRYGLVYSSSDAERVDGLTYAWRKLHAQVRVYRPFFLERCIS